MISLNVLYGFAGVSAALLLAYLAGTRKPDLLVLDLGLPDGDGLDVIRDVRGWSGVPIIVLSARSEQHLLTETAVGFRLPNA